MPITSIVLSFRKLLVHTFIERTPNTTQNPSHCINAARERNDVEKKRDRENVPYEHLFRSVHFSKL